MTKVKNKTLEALIKAGKYVEMDSVPEDTISIIDNQITVYQNLVGRVPDNYVTSMEFTTDSWAYKVFANTTGIIVDKKEGRTGEEGAKPAIDFLKDKERVYAHSTSFTDIIYPIFSFSKGIIKKRRNNYNENESTLKSYKESYIKYFDLTETSRINLLTTEKKLKTFIRDLKRNNLEIKNSKFVVTFNDVTAEDTQAKGEDIYLGDLTYEISVLYKTIHLTNGTEPRDGAYYNGGYHPHQMSDGICLGTADLEMSEAINSLQLPIILRLLNNFSHCYNSLDYAGRTYRAWTDDPDEDRSYCERYDQYYDGDACRYSEYEDDHIPNDESVYSEEQESELWIDRATEVEGEWFIEQSDSIIMIADYWYLKDSDDVVCIDDEWYITEDLTWSEIENRWLLENEDTVEQGGGHVSLAYYEEHIEQTEEIEEVVETVSEEATQTATNTNISSSKAL